MSDGLLAQGFPAAPAGCEGWPWTVESATDFPGDDWPKLTIVTPSYMQGEFLEQTIRSVLLQNYPNLEYFVLDGGSTDGSRAIIEKYAPWLAGWRCEKDAGQAATIVEGWSRGTGEVCAWINSDDWYQPGAFAAAAPLFRGSHPASWVAGAVDDCAGDGTFLRRHAAAPVSLAATLGFQHFGYHQPGMFWSRRLIDKVGPLDGGMHVCFDLDFWARSLIAEFSLTSLDAPIACFRQHSGSKTARQFEVIVEESRAIFQRYSAQLSPAGRRESAACLRRFLADYLLHLIYRYLRQGWHARALRLFLREVPTLLALRPRKLMLGALYRVLITGHPPDWFSGNPEDLHAT